MRAEGANYRADFGGSGAELRTRAADDGHEAHLALRLVGYTRQGAASSVGADASAVLVDGRVVYEHAGVHEQYTPSASGFEQSFRFDSRPAGHGDLHLSIAVSGNVSAPATAASRHQALEFLHEGGRAIGYGEAYAFDRSGSMHPVSTAYDGAGRITLTVPAALVDGAVYPLIVDPVVGPVLNPGGPSFTDEQSSVAHDVENDRYLVVWKRRFATTNGIRAQLYNGDGSTASGLLIIAEGAGFDAPDVALCRAASFLTAPSRFLIVWSQPNGIHGRLLATNGNTLGSAFQISSPGTSRDDRPSVSGPGIGQAMVAWDRTAPAQPSPDRILVRNLRFSGTTLLPSPERVLEQVTSGFVRDVELASSDVAVQVSGATWNANRAVWSRWFTSPAPGDHDVRTAAFRFGPATEFVLLQSPQAVPGGGDVGVNELSPSIASSAPLHQNGDEVRFLVAFQDQQVVRAARFGLTSATGSAFDIGPAGEFTYEPAVGAGHCEFTVGYLQSVGEFVGEVHAARVLLDGTVAVRRLVENAVVANSGLTASSRPILTTATEQHNTVMLSWTSISDIRARFFEPVQPQLIPVGTACPGPGGTLPVIGTSGGLPIAGNQQFAFTIANAPPNALAVLLIGNVLTTTAVPGAPGCWLYMGLPVLQALPATLDATGSGSIPLPVPCSIGDDTVLAFQWAVLTPGFNPFGGISSAGVDVRWDH